MKRRWVAIGLLASVGSVAAASAEESVLDFEQAQIGKPVPTWTEKGVVFKLARPLANSTAVGRIMFFPHLATNHKGILNAMATEQAIPVQATFASAASSVTVVFWGSTGCPALLEALDANGAVVDRASIAAAPGREAPEDPVPFFQLTVNAPSIAAIRFSGPRDGEFLAADEIRITPSVDPAPARQAEVGSLRHPGW
ncbi:MAG TPA: hypothetical protein VM146_01295 [Steroidobacteraceae bacterium]|nr:hypothetical protein [Steroidobacteraceae bacterium]